MTPENINLLRDNGICVVEAKDPSKVKFVDPLPAVSSRTQMEDACIKLTKKLLAGHLFEVNRRDFANLYVDCLTEGTALDINYKSQEEREKEIVDMARHTELVKIGREEARAERAKKLNQPK